MLPVLFVHLSLKSTAFTIFFFFPIKYIQILHLFCSLLAVWRERARNKMPLAQRINDLRKHGFRTGNTLSPQASTAQVQVHSSTKIVNTGKDKPELRKSKRLQEATDGIKNTSTKDSYIIASVERLDVLFHRGYSGYQLSNPTCTGQLDVIWATFVIGFWVRFNDDFNAR